MGSSDERAVLQLEDENLVRLEHFDRKASSLGTAPQRSYDLEADDDSHKSILYSIRRNINIFFFSNKLNILVPCGPLAILVDELTDQHGWTFILSLLGIIPLAERLGSWLFLLDLQLKIFTVGGLLNATFGNATELIISMYALKSGMIRVVQQSLLGSILSNTLLVLGCAFFGGGIVHSNKEQLFDKGTAGMNSGLLLMAVMCLLFPAVLHVTHTEVHFGKSELALSRFSSCIMLIAYGAYLFFQLTNQKNLYMPMAEEEDHIDGSADDEETPEISKWWSMLWLSVMTLWIAVLSEYLVNTIEGASVAMNIPVAFISVIVLPIVGNAAEHAGAVMFACKDKLDISLGVAIGSSTQIAMFGIPFCVVVGWIIGSPMNLDFQMFETATLFMTVLVVAFMLQDGTSNYFKGLMLLFCYLIVAASFFVHIDPESIQDKPQKHIG
ncbi:vacuolar cation/proton exchanger 3-like isoform X1 [Solanum stenotomum]|uniref:vacuolar cation/proton exchanger 3-like isoform X1 n=1 Tax=Solanum stenotomum TaxID=172797 RepID=UPI0020D1E0C3|nr:vacuolar cation/proton exchanger 3-like isoform X1 [Solanum stenotomum]